MDTRPWFERKRFVVPIAVAAIVGGLLLAGGVDEAGANGTVEGAASHPSATAHPAVDDVQLLRCRPDDADHWTPHVRITNHSSESSSYVLTFTIEDRDDHHAVGPATVVVDRVAPGATAEQVGTSQVAGDDLWCRATSVVRLATG
jgi:hypothetical protein